MTVYFSLRIRKYTPPPAIFHPGTLKQAHVAFKRKDETEMNLCKAISAQQGNEVPQCDGYKAVF